jgi:glucose/arabinose dehydrogenase
MRRRGLVTLVLAGLVAAALAASALGRQEASRQQLGIQSVLRGFDTPVLLTSAPGEPGARYVVEQDGRVLRLAGGRRTVFLDVRSAVTAGGEQGLLGLAFHPRYARNRTFFVAYTSADDRNVVARYRSNGARAIPSSRREIFSVRDPYGNHNGGHLAFGPDGRLYTTVGDGGSGGDPEDRSQSPRSRFGKLLRINVDAAPAKVTIAALGLRNAWRFSFDRSTGDIWLGDVGQGAIEEIDWAAFPWQGQVNFGWDVYEGSRSFEDKPLGPGRLIGPVAEYSHDDGCSVTGGYVYRGKAVPAAVGRYFYGDYCSGTVWSLRLQNGKAADLRREPFSVDSLSSFGEDAAGELYLVSHGGTIYRLR